MVPNKGGCWVHFEEVLNYKTSGSNYRVSIQCISTIFLKYPWKLIRTKCQHVSFHDPFSSGRALN